MFKEMRKILNQNSTYSKLKNTINNIYEESKEKIIELLENNYKNNLILYNKKLNKKLHNIPLEYSLDNIRIKEKIKNILKKNKNELLEKQLNPEIEIIKNNIYKLLNLENEENNGLIDLIELNNFNKNLKNLEYEKSIQLDSFVLNMELILSKFPLGLAKEFVKLHKTTSEALNNIEKKRIQYEITLDKKAEKKYLNSFSYKELKKDLDKNKTNLKFIENQLEKNNLYVKQKKLKKEYLKIEENLSKQYKKILPLEESLLEIKQNKNNLDIKDIMEKEEKLISKWKEKNPYYENELNLILKNKENLEDFLDEIENNLLKQSGFQSTLKLKNNLKEEVKTIELTMIQEKEEILEEMIEEKIELFIEKNSFQLLVRNFINKYKDENFIDTPLSSYLIKNLENLLEIIDDSEILSNKISHISLDLETIEKFKQQSTTQTSHLNKLNDEGTEELQIKFAVDKKKRTLKSSIKNNKFEEELLSDIEPKIIPEHNVEEILELSSLIYEPQNLVNYLKQNDFKLLSYMGKNALKLENYLGYKFYKEDDTKTNQAMILEDKNGQIFLISEGTEFTSINDWIQNKKIIQRKPLEYYDQLSNFFNNSKKILKDDNNKKILGEYTKIIFGGHSQGGFLSQLLAYENINNLKKSYNISGPAVTEMATIVVDNKYRYQKLFENLFNDEKRNFLAENSMHIHRNVFDIVPKWNTPLTKQFDISNTTKNMDINQNFISSHRIPKTKNAYSEFLKLKNGNKFLLPLTEKDLLYIASKDENDYELDKIEAINDLDSFLDLNYYFIDISTINISLNDLKNENKDFVFLNIDKGKVLVYDLKNNEEISINSNLILLKKLEKDLLAFKIYNKSFSSFWEEIIPLSETTEEIYKNLNLKVRNFINKLNEKPKNEIFEILNQNNILINNFKNELEKYLNENNIYKNKFTFNEISKLIQIFDIKLKNNYNIEKKNIKLKENLKTFDI